MRATRKCAAGQIWPAGQGLRTAGVEQENGRRKHVVSTAPAGRQTEPNIDQWSRCSVAGRPSGTRAVACQYTCVRVANAASVSCNETIMHDGHDEKHLIGLQENWMTGSGTILKNSWSRFFIFVCSHLLGSVRVS